jgi:ketosteroid isomerase-like protein
VVFEFEIRSGPCCKVDAYFKFTTLETDKVDVWRFENGRAVAFAEYYDTAAIAAAS